MGQGKFFDDIQPSEPYTVEVDSKALIPPTLVYQGDIQSFSAANDDSVVVLTDGRVLYSKALSKFEELSCTNGIKVVKASLSASHFGVISGITSC